MQYNTDLLHEHKTKSSLPPSSSSRHDFIYYGLRTISAVLSDLHTRWARRPFSSVTLFEFKDTTARAVRAMLRDAGSNSASSFASTLLRTMPWCVPFYDRLTLFREIISEDR